MSVIAIRSMKKGLSDKDVLQETGFINLTEDGSKLSGYKDRVLYTGLVVNRSSVDEERDNLQIDYSTLQHPLYTEEEVKIQQKAVKK